MGTTSVFNSRVYGSYLVFNFLQITFEANSEICDTGLEPKKRLMHVASAANALLLLTWPFQPLLTTTAIRSLYPQ